MDTLMSAENEAAAVEVYNAPQPVRLLAKLFSYLLHPLFIPTYFFLWVMFRFPYEFAGMDEHTMNVRLLGTFWTTAFFPAFAVFLLWRLKFISSIMLRIQKERIVPYVITMFFYWWMWYLSKNFKDQPSVLKFFYLGIFLTTVAGLIFNNFVKISMHAMGMAGILVGVILTCFVYQTHQGLDLSVVIIATGIVCTSRLVLNDHSTGEVWLGLFAGIFCQLIAYFFTFIW